MASQTFRADPSDNLENINPLTLEHKQFNRIADKVSRFATSDFFKVSSYFQLSNNTKTSINIRSMDDGNTIEELVRVKNVTAVNEEK